MRRPAVRFILGILLAVAVLVLAPQSQAGPEPQGEDELTVQTAGLMTDGPALVEFFRARARMEADREQLDLLAKQFSAASSQHRRRAVAELIGLGPVAIPVLRRAASEIGAEAAGRAQECLRWVEGPMSATLTAAAARLVALRMPDGAAAALLGYLPFADNAEVAKEVITALGVVTAAAAKLDPALLRGLADPVPARRAGAGVVLARAGPPEQLPAVRKLLDDPSVTVRLGAARALAEAHDAAGVAVLIDLLFDLPAEQRRPVEDYLAELAGEWAPAAGFVGEDEIARRIRRDAWAAWWKNTDGPSLLAAIRKRTLTAEGRDKVRGLIRALGSEDFNAREQAVADLFDMGSLTLPLLREAVKDKDLEISRRATATIERIEKEPAHHLPSAAFRMLALHKPADAAETLLAFLPFARGETQDAEARAALAVLAVREGKPAPVLVRALEDKSPATRAAAGEALARSRAPVAIPLARPLLKDADPEVRLRAGLALAEARERDAVPVLIDLLTVLPSEGALQVQNALYQLAGEKAPETPAGTDDKAERKKCRDDWAAWWKDNAATADLAKLTTATAWMGFTLLCEGNNGRVVELGRDGKQRWAIDGLAFPIDATVLPGNRVLIAEHHNRRVSERDFKGAILWQKENLNGQPVNAQRLPNGNTFIATNQQLLVVDRAGKELFTHNIVGGISAALKGRDGRITVLTQQGQCIRLDAAGKELKTFASNRPGWVGGLDLLPNGHILITQPHMNKVVEFDGEGKTVRSVDVQQPTSAFALPNGNLLVSSQNTQRVVEVDRKGKEIWTHGGSMTYTAKRR